MQQQMAKRASVVMMFMLVFSMSVSFGFTLAQATTATTHIEDTLVPYYVWRWVTTGLLGLIAVMLKAGWSAFKRWKKTLDESLILLRKDMKRIADAQHNFALDTMQLLGDLHPEQQDKINDKYNPYVVRGKSFVTGAGQ